MGVFFAFMLLIYLVFNSTPFQNFIIHRVDKWLSGAFKTEITIDKINYDGWTYFSIDNIYWGDQKKDTLFFVKNLQFDIAGMEIDSMRFVLDDVRVNGALCKIVTYPDKTFNIDVLFNIFDPLDTVIDPNAPKFNLYFNDITAENTRFHLIDSTEKFSPEGFDPYNICFSNINLRAKHFKIIEDSLHFKMRSFSGVERSGFAIQNMKSITTICPTLMEFDKMRLETDNSIIKDFASMKYDSWDSVASNFISNVYMKGNIRESEVDIKDIAFFAPLLNTFHYKAIVNSKLSGTIDNFKLKDVDVRYGNYTRFKGQVALNGLPNIDQTFIDVQTDFASSIENEIEKIIDYNLPDEFFHSLGLVKYKGNYTGFINDFVSYGEIETVYGKITTDLNMKLPDFDPARSSYSGNLDLKDFNLGGLINQRDLIGFTTLKSSVQGKGLDTKHINANINTQIAYIDFNQYKYNNIDFIGLLNKKYFSGKMNCDDENVKFNINGKADFNKDIPEFIFKSDIETLKLKELHFWDKDINVQTHIDGDFRIKDFDHNSGNLNITNTFLEYKGSEYTINHIDISSVNENRKKLSINSDFLNASIDGDFNFLSLDKSMKNLVNKLVPAYYTQSFSNLPKQNFVYNIKVKNTYNISQMFFPNIDLDKFELQGKYDNSNNIFDNIGYAQTFRYNNYYVSDLTFKTNVSSDMKADLLLGISQLSRNDTMLINEFAVKGSVAQNKGNLQVKMQDTSSYIYSNLNTNFIFKKDLIQMSFDTSEFHYNNSHWNVNSDGMVYLYDSIIKFNNVSFQNKLQQIAINGNYAMNGAEESLLFTLVNFNLDNLNSFMPRLNIKVNGEANGNITLQSVKKKMVINSNLDLNDVMLDNDSIGFIQLTSDYDAVNERLNFIGKALSGKLNNFVAAGYVFMKNSTLDIDVNFDNAEVKAFNAFVKDYITIYDGLASLKCKITGTISRPNVDGVLEAKNIVTRIEYLKTTYRISDKIIFDENSIQLLPTKIYDVNNLTADIEGTIKHKGFDNFIFDINIHNFKKFQMLNTIANDNSLYYGTAYGTGYFTIKGPFNNMVLDINARTEKGTLIYLTPFGNSDDNEESLIHYVNYDTTFKEIVVRKNVLSGFSLNMNVKATPDAEMQIIFDEQTDDKLRARGTGDVRLELTRQGAFNMYGEVTLSSGDYQFSAVNVVSKKFLLQSGSKITWGGDPFDARLNITGLYPLRTTINEIYSTTASTQNTNTKIPVECLMNIRGNLSSPIYSFDINFPNLENSLSGTEANGLNAVVSSIRKEPENMTQQVISLLVFGKFTPLANVNQNNNVSNNIGVNTLSDLASSQINNALNKVVPGFDFSVDMQNAIAVDPTKGRSFLLSASKKFFDNRLEVMGSFATDNSQNNIITQYNISRSGNFKARAFNRQALNPIYDKNITTQGLGLYYRKEFDNFYDLFNIRKKKMVSLK